MTRGFRRTAAALVAAGAIALAAGCGGDSESSALSADELRTQADAICTDVNAANDAIAAPMSADGILPFLQATRDANQSGLDRLSALTPPEELADLWGQAIALNESQLELIAGAIGRIEGGEDPEAVINEVGPQAQANSDQLDELAQQLGLTVCGADGAQDEPAPDATGDAVPAEQYLADNREATQALTELAAIPGQLSGPEELGTRTDDLTAIQGRFDAAIGRMAGYTVDDPALEEQRAALVAQGPVVSDVLGRLIAAAEADDLAALGTLIPELSQALGDFSAAAAAAAG